MQQWSLMAPGHVMSGTVDVGRNALWSLLARAAGFLGFWLILSEFSAVDLLVGVLAALMAASASLRLLPPERWTFRPAALAGLRPFLGSPFGPESTLRGARSIHGCHCDLASWAIDPNCWQARRAMPSSR